MSSHLLDGLIRRDAQLQRFATYLRNQYLDQALMDFTEQLPSLMGGYESLSRRELNKFTQAISGAFAQHMDDAWIKVADELYTMAEAEGAHIADIYDNYDERLKPPTATTMRQIVTSSILALASGSVTTSGVWSEFMQHNTQSNKRVIEGIIKGGFRDGETAQTIVQRLVGKYDRKAKRRSGGAVHGLVRARAENLVRTGVSHFANRGREAFAEQNAKYITKKIFFATLDHRTTMICASLHLNEYRPKDKRAPVLPLHYGERSLYLYATNRYDPLTGQRPAIGGTAGGGDKFDARKSRRGGKVVKYQGRKDSDIFDVDVISAKVGYGQWLKRQPRWFVEEALGKTRAKLFMDGGLDIKSFTDMSGRPLTLDELKQSGKADLAFLRAGLG